MWGCHCNTKACVTNMTQNRSNYKVGQSPIDRLHAHRGVIHDNRVYVAPNSLLNIACALHWAFGKTVRYPASSCTVDQRLSSR